MKILTEECRLEAVRQVAKLAHAKQVDKCGEPYFRHLERVANRCNSISAKIVAYLHDIVEDGHISHNALASMGLCTGHELYCIRLLDKKHNGNLSLEHLVARASNTEDMGYLINIKSLPITREVKIADLMDNMDVSRFIRTNTPMRAADRTRLQKYERSLTFLQS